MKINVCSETEFLRIRGEGVSTSFLTCIELLGEGSDLEVLVNNEGQGDVMHSHTYGPYFFWRGRKYKGRRVHTVHVIPDSIKGSVPAARWIMPFFKWYFRKVYSYADVCIAISPMVEKVIRDLGADTTIVRLSNPLFTDRWKRNPELRNRGRQLLGLSQDDFCILGVGQLEGRKGCEDFIEIGKQVNGAQFRWIGGRPFGIMTEGVQKLNKSIKNAPVNVKFQGIVPLADMPEIYAAGDLFLFPSYQENCPLAPLEAAASGMPVIYRDLEEYKLLYTYDYLKADSILQFVENVKKLMHSKDEYEKGMEISSNLVKQFDKNTIRKKLVEIYSSLCRPLSQE